MTEAASDTSIVSMISRGEAKWQADRCSPAPSGRSSSSGMSVLHLSWTFQHRVWNRQPDGGLAGEGTSPLRTICSFLSRSVGSGTGTADSRAWV